MTENPAEMPFLDHLEELRWRIIWSLGALVVGVVVGFFVVMRFDLLTRFMQTARLAGFRRISLQVQRVSAPEGE